MKKHLPLFALAKLLMLAVALHLPAGNASAQNLNYQQDFSDFVFAIDTEVSQFGANNEWSFQATGTHGTRLKYMEHWGQGTATGFRGNDRVLGYQHSGTSGDFTATLTLPNQTGETISLVSISYLGRVARTSENRHPAWEVRVNGVEVPALAYSTGTGEDQQKTADVAVSVPPGQNLVITWTSDRGFNASGSSRQIGIADLSVTSGEATQVATPRFDPSGGRYYEPQTVNITTVTDGATIYYTTNGDEPTPDSHLFTDPIEVNEDMQVRARAFKEGLDPSQMVEASYEIRVRLLWKDFEDESLLSGGWSVVDLVAGSNSWEIDDFDGITYAMITEHQSNPPNPHSWLISPQVDLTEVDGPIMQFMNQAAHRNGDALSVKASMDYDGQGDPSEATWTSLPATWDSHTGGGFGSWTSSGEIDLSEFSGQRIHIGFEYKASAGVSGRWHLTDILAYGVESGLSSDVSLATFAVGGINALPLGGLRVDDPQEDAGALLYVEDFTDFKGIEVSPTHPEAGFEVRLNGDLLAEADLADQALANGDVILVQVVAENGVSQQHYKLTTRLDEREITLVKPLGGERFETFDLITFEWTSSQVNALLLELMVRADEEDVVMMDLEQEGGDGSFSDVVPNGLHGVFKWRLSDLDDPSFFRESDYFDIVDVVDPEMMFATPVSGDEGVSVNTRLAMLFDERFLIAGEGSIYIHRQNDDHVFESIQAASAQVDIDSSWIYVNLSDELEYLTTYYVLIDPNAFRDAAGNYFPGISEPASWTFTTEDEPELICNGDFEFWTGGLPDCWHGSKSNIGAENVVQYSANPHTGPYAVQLVNPESGHRRFTTQPTSVQDGVTYTFNFMVKGKGEIRTGLFDDRPGDGFGYAPYNNYVNVNSSGWTRVQQTITAANNMDEAEFIFSIRNTDPAMGHLQLDHVRIEAPRPTQVTSIAELRSGDPGAKYTLVTEALVSFYHPGSGRLYIQDNTAAILVQDVDQVISTNYQVGDAISGITATLDVQDNMIRLIPGRDPGAPGSRENTINPVDVRLQDLTSDHQALLVRLQGVSFSQATGNFIPSTNYDISSSGGDGVFRTIFSDLDYVGTPVPEQPQNLTVLVGQFLDQIQVTARSLADFEEATSVSSPEWHAVRVYPNPMGSMLHISSTEQIERILLLSINGQLIAQQPGGEREVSFHTEGLPSGVYLLRLVGAGGKQQSFRLIKP